jgi:hypothetical protein
MRWEHVIAYVYFIVNKLKNFLVIFNKDKYLS